MPELPEVETVVRQLRPVLVGARLKRWALYDPSCVSQQRPAIEGLRLAQVTRLGKQVVIALDSGADPLWLAVHLRMTGRLLWTAGADAEPPRARVRSRMVTDRGVLDFADVRRFGTIKFASDIRELEPEGLDPTSAQFSPARLAQLLTGSGQELKIWLLRQDRLCGLGNIYASEILFRAALSPWQRAGDLDEQQVARLQRSTVDLLSAAIRHCGTTFSDFQGADGLTGSYQQYLSVYGRHDQPCHRCDTPVRRAVQQGRATFYCPGCQPLVPDFGPAEGPVPVAQPRRAAAEKDDD